MLNKLKKFKKAWDLVDEVEELPEPIKGNGKAVFMSDGTQEDYEGFVDDQRGWTKFFKKK